MDKDILYFYESGSSLLEIGLDYEKQHPVSFEKTLSIMLLKEFTTLQGRMDAIRRILPNSYNLPLYINRYLILFRIPKSPFGDSGTVWINGVNVESCFALPSGSQICFRGGKTLQTEKSISSVKAQLDKIRILREL